jgi:3-methyladenine DNA glycosylase AlkD
VSVAELIASVDAAANPADAATLARYFKTGPGEYGEGDTFIGVKLSTLRGLVKPYVRAGLPLADLEKALASPVHEHRQAVLVVLADRAARATRPTSADQDELAAIYELYLRNTAYVDNWDLVDGSAPEIVGGYLLDRPRTVLRELVASSNLWERRIALVSTHRFIRAGQTADTYELAALVLDDKQDLIHKASGWMLREAGKRVDEGDLLAFLDKHAARMPRTMLRYAIERLPADVRKDYLTRRRR